MRQATRKFNRKQRGRNHFQRNDGTQFRANATNNYKNKYYSENKYFNI